MDSDAQLGATLLMLARNAIGNQLGTNQRASGSATESTTDSASDSATESRLREPGATFVTLTQQVRLRGCIGSLQAWRSLADDVVENARAAAFRDPRFPPLAAGELAQTSVEVSLLTPATPLEFASEMEALSRLRPHLDGVVLEWGTRRATFLPQVWEQLPEPRQFMARLKEKAGLPADFWDAALHLSTYRVEKWKES